MTETGEWIIGILWGLGLFISAIDVENYWLRCCRNFVVSFIYACAMMIFYNVFLRGGA